MDARVSNEDDWPTWRVTGFRRDERNNVGLHGRMVAAEFWVDIPESKGTHYAIPGGFSPDGARRLAQHLIEMADYAEEKA